MRSVSKLLVAGVLVVAAGAALRSLDAQSRATAASAMAQKPPAMGTQAPAARSAVAPGITVTRADYLAYARASADYTWDHRDESVARWRETFDPSSPFGYRAPGGLIDLASIYATLYEMERNPVYADRTKQVLLTYGDYRSQFPESAAKARPDYSNGVPALPDFFVVMRYLRA
jgi:acyl dehydratase